MFKEKLKRGSGEFLGFAIVIVLLMQMLTVFTSLIITQKALADMDYAVITASRETIVCDGMDTAKEKADEIVRNALSRNPSISDIQVDIKYTPGSPQEWKKGSYIDVAVIARIHTQNPFIDDVRHVKETIMIEHH